MAVQWGLSAQPVNPLQALQAFGMAQQQQQQRIQQEQERAQQQREFKLRERQAGLQERKFSDEARKAALGQVSQAAADVLRRPENERAQVWDSYIDQFAQTDPSAAQFKGQYSEQRLRALLAQTGELDNFNKANDPKLNITGTGNGSYVVQRGNQLLDPNSGQWVDYGQGGGSPQVAAPQAQHPTNLPGAEQGGFMTVAQAKAIGQGTNFSEWQKRSGTPVLVNSPEEAAALPSGTLLISPDGRRVVKR